MSSKPASLITLVNKGTFSITTRDLSLTQLSKVALSVLEKLISEASD